MKKILVLIFLCTFVYYGECQINTHDIFAPINAEWYYNCCAEGNINSSHLNYIISKKDTIIGKDSCHILQQYRDNSTTVNAEYIIRQDDGKIYYYYQKQYNLLFDFGVEINDIVEFKFIYKKYTDNILFQKDTVLSARYKVKNITTNAQYQKIFTTKILDDDKVIENGKEIFPNYYSYTEKLGYDSEFMPILDNLAYPAIDNFLMLRCYSDSSFVFISDRWEATSLPCNYFTTTGINMIEAESTINIFPNPFYEHISVSSNGQGYIEIIDTNGNVIYYSKLLDGLNKISTNHFFKGIYVIKVQNQNNCQSFKIIKL
jgi:hypothetical protein